MAWRKSLVWAVDTPISDKWFVFFPLTCRSTCGLGERPINPPPPPGRYAPAVCGPWFAGQGHQGVVYLCWCILNTTAVVIIMLGFMTFKVWHEQESGKVGGGGRKCWWLSQTRELKMGVSDPTLCIKRRYPPKQTSDFRNGTCYTCRTRSKEIHTMRVPWEEKPLLLQVGVEALQDAVQETVAVH